MAGDLPFWVDHEYDREHGGRYADRVRASAAEFADAFGDIAPVTFACTAWRLAVPPALSPGYVRWHRRVLEATCTRNEWDGGLAARVQLVSPWPAELTWSREWYRDGGWRGWPELFGQYVLPTERDLTRSPHLRAVLLVEAPLPLDELPPAPDGPDDHVVDAAGRAVMVLVKELSYLLAPIIRQLECGVPAN
jgi:hypothetical protein